MRVVAAAAVMASAVVANAQPAPVPYYPAGYPNAPYAQYPLAPPAPPPPPRTGLELYAMVAFPDGHRAPSLALYLPMPGVPRLKLGITGSFQYHYEVIFGIEVYGWALTPLVRVDFPVSKMRLGYVSLAIEGGPSFGASGLRGRAAPYMPPNWQVTDYYGAYAGVAFVAQSHMGLNGWVKPVGFAIGFADEEPEKVFGIGRDQFVYEFAVGVGYQFK